MTSLIPAGRDGAEGLTFAGLAIRLQGVTSGARAQVAALRVLAQEVTRLGRL